MREQPRADLRLRRRVGLAHPQRPAALLQRAPRGARHAADDVLARSDHRVDVDLRGETGQVGEIRRVDRQRPQRRVGVPVGDDGGHQGAEDRIVGQRRTRGGGLHRGEHRGAVDPLRGVPAVDGVAVVGGEEREVGVGAVELEADGRREAAVERGHRPGVDGGEHEARAALGQGEYPRRRAGLGLAGQGQRQVAPGGIEQADRERDVERLLVRLARRRGCLLLEVERIGARCGVEGAARADDRGAGLRVPAAELAEVDARGVLQRLHEIVAGDRLAVVTREVEVEPVAEALGAEQRVLHPDDLGALLVDRGGVEVVDLDVLVGPHRVRHGPGVLGELGAAQEGDRGDALHGARVEVARELLVAEDRQALLQRKLEPVAAGDAVAAPVVEVLVADDSLDRLVVVVGRGIRTRQHQPAVEDVEALVLHRAHVEVVGAEDHEGVEVVLAPEALLVPAHRPLQRGHRVPAAVEVGGRRPDFQCDVAAGGGREAVGQRGEVARDQREQVRRLGKRIVPAHEVPPVAGVAGADPVAVGQQHGIAFAVGHQRHRVDGEDVGPVGKVGDPAEALGFALRAEHPRRHVKALQRHVGGGLDRRLHGEFAALGRVDDRECVVGEPVAGRRQRHPVERDADVLLLLAVEDERRRGVGVDGRIAAERERRADAGPLRVEVEPEVEAIDQERGRPVIEAAHRGRRRVARRRGHQLLTSMSSTSNSSVALGGISPPPAPRSP